MKTIDDNIVKFLKMYKMLESLNISRIYFKIFSFFRKTVYSMHLIYLINVIPFINVVSDL